MAKNKDQHILFEDGPSTFKAITTTGYGTLTVRDSIAEVIRSSRSPELAV